MAEEEKNKDSELEQPEECRECGGEAEKAEGTGEEAQVQEKAENAGEEAQVQEEPKQPSPEEIIAELNDKYLRLRADFDNYRKRMARESDEIRERSKILVISDFLPVYDFFKMAMDHAGRTDDLNALKQGMQMILNEFKRAFDGLGVKEIQAVGKKFDPKMHEAMKTEASDTVPEGIVLSQWKSGFFVGERLARPATVVVSSGPAKPAEQAPEPEEKAEQADEAAQNPGGN